MPWVGCYRTHWMGDYRFTLRCFPSAFSVPLNVVSLIAFSTCSCKSLPSLLLILLTLVCRKRPFTTCSKIYGESDCSYSKLCKNPSYDEMCLHRQQRWLIWAVSSSRLARRVWSLPDILLIIILFGTTCMWIVPGVNRGAVFLAFLWLLEFLEILISHAFKSWNVHNSRADRHMPSYAKKLVAMYNQNGEIDKLLSRETSQRWLPMTWGNDIYPETCRVSPLPGSVQKKCMLWNFLATRLSWSRNFWPAGLTIVLLQSFSGSDFWLVLLRR